MIRRAVLLSAGLYLALAASAQAQKLSLPVGEWGYGRTKGPDCRRPFLKIEEKRIVQRLDEGEGRCTIRKASQKGKTFSIKMKCDWDESVPLQMREGADDFDDDSYSIKIVGPTKILFNNNELEFCFSGVKKLQ